MLENFFITSRINQNWSSSGMDTLEKCLDKNHFKNYPYNVSYSYNSRGFRDSEWPNDIDQCIWGIGDSFTVGIGAPIEHAWTSILSKIINQPVINCGMDGTSNDWLADRALELLTEIGPPIIIIQWSYLHRRQLDKKQIHFDTDATTADDIDNLINNMSRIELEKNNTTIIHSTIPYRHLKNPKILHQVIVKKLPNGAILIPPINQVDFARDYHHYDKITSQQYAKSYAELLP